MTEQFLNQARLANRWQISPRTLERWRWKGEGPAFVKIGGRVVYRLEEIEADGSWTTAWEATAGTVLPTPEPPAVDRY